VKTTIDEAEATIRRRAESDTHGLDLFASPAHSRRTDPETSHAAGAQNRKQAAAAQKNHILKVLLAHGALTADGIDEILEAELRPGEWLRTTAGRRLPEMAAAGIAWVVRSTELRETRRGELAKLWKLTGAGLVIARQLQGAR
jgi:hypothetical protein